ncbi:glutathione S-transferase family protein [Streptomyces phytohabitans]|uniref:glutathione S-transferase family protein n=1 Tax=Streptomyces phytohabitans TaxID=1150371 RepID=UPI00345B5105
MPAAFSPAASPAAVTAATAVTAPAAAPFAASARAAPVPRFRGRIGRDARSGHYAVPRRYRLHLAPSCPESLQLAVVHGLLDLGDTLPVTPLPAVPDAPGGGHRALAALYEASWHQHPGPAVAPVLSDDWTGTIVSTHTPDILRDLARRFGGHGPDLYPAGAEEAVDTLGRLCARAVRPAATATTRADGLAELLGALEVWDRRLAVRPYLLGDAPSLADVETWAALLAPAIPPRPLDTLGADAAAYGHVWAYARRLTADPAFGGHLPPDARAALDAGWPPAPRVRAARG